MNRQEPRTPGPRRDLVAAGLAVLLVTAAVVVGRVMEDRDGSLHVNWPPLYAKWDPHVGPGTPAALAVAVAVVAHGPVLAARLPWRALLGSAWAASTAWIWSLALVDGWHRGVAERLTTKYEYLRVVDRFDDIPAALRDFTQHIVQVPGEYHWPAHTAGHPPAAPLTFVFLDRIGLGGGGWAGAFVITAGSTAVLAVLITLRALGDEAVARRAAPFLVLAPAAVWMGASADGYFAAVAAWMTALLALAATRAVRCPALAATGAGLLFGLTCYLSYGLTLFAVVVAGVLLIARTVRPLPYFVAGAVVVPLVFTALGFNWWEAYHLLVDRYYQGAAGVRPYWYWIWANPACTVLVVGLATVAGLRRTIVASPGAVRRWRARETTAADRLVGVVLVALLAVAAADLSGMSKAETERIWLPFALFLLPAAALLPRPAARAWLTAQAVLALAVNHLLFTGW
ncbi:hypothetical protein ABT390_25475 [Streptomyces aurantiacus]|uniref:Glycosyltransferase RgtA/B/C/D-like domain-containing protein n=1 Tax=Streptomyces aurantiacus JA 4570 TaxID=1286094 RepID=S3ZTP1_9ACTN|nr:hypothetical protein [Streptomyces aurantiacus]EPH46811.1 hypothetical protein STRAU_0224 [Streptomyces aurantiacus JA 4570]